MPRVLVTVGVAAPSERVWQALTVPDEVRRWDGVEPIGVPAGYPAPGQHARWRSSLGPVSLTLHDRVKVVEPGVRLAATIDVGFVHVDEEYRLSVVPGGTQLVSDNDVSSRVPGLNRLAARLTRSSVERAMARLRAFCEEARPRARGS